jgi:Zn-dependent membrane protease YugP
MPVFAFLFWDPTFILLIPAMLFGFWAQMRVKSAYNAGLQVASRRGLSGREVAERLLRAQGLTGVSVRSTQGQLDDHYDPRNRTVNLSPAVHDGASLASLAIAAHETGHALQHGQSWVPLALRSAIAPTVGFASTLAFPLFFIGFIFSSARLLMDLGIVFFAGAVLFHMVTLPVEFDASRRAMALLRDGRYLEVDEAAGAKKVLDAAALTYVAAAAVSIMHLVRLLVLRNSRD